MLKINPDKGKLLFVCKPKFKHITKYFSFVTKDFEIKPVPTLKVLGSFISQDLSQEREISQLIPQLNNRINDFEKLNQFTDFHRRLQFSNSYIIGRLIYMMPTYTNLSKSMKGR